MKKIVRLTESDLTRIFKRVIKENNGNLDINEVPPKYAVVRKYKRMTNNDFFSDFIRRYGNKHDFEDRLLNDYIQSEEDMGDFDSEDDFYDQWDPETEIYMLETEFRNFPGIDLWTDFYNELVEAGW